MPRYRNTEEAAATIVGRLSLLIAAGNETSATLAEKLNVTPRQVNRYVSQLVAAGWKIEREGAKKLGGVRIVLRSPRIVMEDSPRKASKKKSKPQE